jgi:hypothetical protein
MDLVQGNITQSFPFNGNLLVSDISISECLMSPKGVESVKLTVIQVED